MYAGRIVETTDAPTLFANPRHPYTEALLDYTEALLDALPERATGTGRLYNIPGGRIGRAVTGGHDRDRRT
jgi:peptide/nickel transport system ATP-binding protein